jgi:hypothetical protein
MSIFSLIIDMFLGTVDHIDTSPECVEKFAVFRQVVSIGRLNRQMRDSGPKDPTWRKLCQKLSIYQQFGPAAGRFMSTGHRLMSKAHRVRQAFNDGGKATAVPVIPRPP